jgi:hypothetical protein
MSDEVTRRLRATRDAVLAQVPPAPRQSWAAPGEVLRLEPQTTRRRPNRAPILAACAATLAVVAGSVAVWATMSGRAGESVGSTVPGAVVETPAFVYHRVVSRSPGDGTQESTEVWETPTGTGEWMMRFTRAGVDPVTTTGTCTGAEVATTQVPGKVGTGIVVLPHPGVSGHRPA